MNKRIASLGAAALIILSSSASPAHARTIWTHEHQTIVAFIACPESTAFPTVTNAPSCPTPGVQTETRHRFVGPAYVAQQRKKIWYYLGETDLAHQGFYASRWGAWRTVPTPKSQATLGR